MGMENAWAFWHMTPVEITGRFTAYGEAQNRALQTADTTAWMIGHYVAIGQHEPKKYPKKPMFVKTKHEAAEMDEDDIKSVLTAYAEVHNAIEEGKNGSHT